MSVEAENITFARVANLGRFTLYLIASSVFALLLYTILTVFGHYRLAPITFLIIPVPPAFGLGWRYARTRNQQPSHRCAWRRSSYLALFTLFYSWFVQLIFMVGILWLVIVYIASDQAFYEAFSAAVQQLSHRDVMISLGILLASSLCLYLINVLTIRFGFWLGAWMRLKRDEGLSEV